MTIHWRQTLTACLISGGLLAAASPFAEAQDQATQGQAAQEGQDPGEQAADDETREPVAREVFESGLVIRDYVIGEGEPVPADAAVTMQFVVTFENGRVLSDTSQMEEPPTFALEMLPAGMRRGIIGMRAGGEREIVIPPELGLEPILRQAGEPMTSFVTMEATLLDFAVLEFEDVEEGEGEACPAGTVVEATISGELEDGTTFDTGADEEPILFSIAAPPAGAQQQIPYAIRKGIVGMKRGGKRKVMAPWSMAYGPQGYPPQVPPRTDVVFTITLADFYDVEINDVVEGEGEVCPKGASVTVRYTGSLENGTVFDTTEGKGAVTFDLDNLIPGWKLGVPGMRVGGTREITIPWQLGYGEQGTGKIPPKSNLFFTIELISFEQ